MASTSNKRVSRNIERIFLLIVSIVFGLLFYQLFQVQKKRFDDVPRRIAEGTMMNVNDSKPGERIKALLTRGYYFRDAKDIDLISSVMEKEYSVQPGLMDNIGELNKGKYNINADEAYERGGESFKKRVGVSRSLLGFTESDTTLFERELTSPMHLPKVTSLAMGSHKITGVVKNKEQAVTGVLVRLQMIIPHDSIIIADVVEAENRVTDIKDGVQKVFIKDSTGTPQLESLMAYARTDEQGNFLFDGLPAGQAFEVLPLQPGYQFGRSKGIEKLTGDVAFAFNRVPHTIKLFSTQDFNNFKKER